MYEVERDTDVHNDVGAILGSLLLAFPDVYMLCHPRRPISFTPLRRELEGSEPTRSGAQAVVERLDRWRGAAVSGAPLAAVTVSPSPAPGPAGILASSP